jgi:serine/threonine protein kinase
MPQVYGDRWEVIRSLGEGGQAVTFLVRDLANPESGEFALKRLRKYARLPRFEKEVQAISQLEHPGIVRLVDSSLEADPAYLVTEFCPGGSLATAYPYWHSGPLYALAVFQQACEAVNHAHSVRIIHRDLKPANIFLRSPTGPAVIGDFGLCFIQGTSPRVTETGEVVGPRSFVAPELEDGRLDDVTPACDVYSLGKLLYWLLAKGRLFSREKHREVEWDLKGKNRERLLGWDNIYMEHINRLLDEMVVLDPTARAPTDTIVIRARWIHRLIEKEFTPVSPAITQPCLYCGEGQYALVVKGTGQIEDFGIMARGSADWRVLACNACGHVQLFRVEKAKRKEWWG